MSTAPRSSIVHTHPRLLAGAVAGIGCGLLAPAGWGWLTRTVLGWDMAATLYLILTITMFVRATHARIQTRARKQDESASIILTIASLGAVFSLVAIVFVLGGSKDAGPAARAFGLTLAIYTIVVSWSFLHTVYAVHYAHLFYRAPRDAPDGPRQGGLLFQGDPATPLYSDFAYHSFTIGMTAQTSDTGISTTDMRGLALAHGILSFLFNTVILALSINILASLI